MHSGNFEGGESPDVVALVGNTDIARHVDFVENGNGYWVGENVCWNAWICWWVGPLASWVLFVDFDVCKTRTRLFKLAESSGQGGYAIRIHTSWGYGTDSSGVMGVPVGTVV